MILSFVTLVVGLILLFVFVAFTVKVSLTLYTSC